MRSPADLRRCAVCGARDWRAAERTLRYPGGSLRAFRNQCGHCGLLCDDPDADSLADELAGRLRGSAFDSRPSDLFGLDLYTLRTAATACLRQARPGDAAQAEALEDPHGPMAAMAQLSELPRVLPAPVTLGILCRMEEVPALLPRLRREGERFAAIVLLADGEPGDLPTRPLGGASPTLAARPLSGDFAAQRNALQDLSRTPFMLQLDSDETVPDALVASLAGLVAMAQETRSLSVGFPRRNLVDGVEADLYPDIQYRLNRRELRFRGVVHERPDFGAWQRSFIALSGAIEHHLSRAHVERRSRAYEAMKPGGGRLEEEDALLSPFRP